MEYKEAYIVATPKCNFRCPDCITQHSRPDRREVRLSLDDVRLFCKRLKDQGVRLRQIIFTGGEPTLWPQLVEAIHEVKQADVCGRVVVITNGYHRNAEDYGLADRVIVSHYGGINIADILRLKRQLGRRCRVQNVRHLPYKCDVDAPLPADCGSTQMILHGDKVYPCAAAWRLADNGIDLAYDFMDMLLQTKTRYQPMCRSCFNNRKVRKTLRKGPILEIRMIGTWLHWAGQVAPDFPALRSFYRFLIRRPRLND